ncbi:hypothetical protein L841_2813 [Mycobacterium sp. MAC_080597_8934]|nr:hypothetical protein L841_2813 [Mycobacterium sp. MAC_080597_8934]
MVNLCCSRPQFASIPLSRRVTAALFRGACPLVGPGCPSTPHWWRSSLIPPYKG